MKLENLCDVAYVLRHGKVTGTPCLVRKPCKSLARPNDDFGPATCHSAETAGARRKVRFVLKKKRFRLAAMCPDEHIRNAPLEKCRPDAP